MNRNHFGNRGEVWVVIQVLLFVLFLLMPQVGPAWPTLFGVVGAVALLCVSHVGPVILHRPAIITARMYSSVALGTVSSIDMRA